MIVMFRKTSCLIVLLAFCALVQTKLTAQSPVVSTHLFSPTADVKSITIDPNKTIGLDMDEEVFESLRKNNPERINLRLPDFNGEEIEIKFQQFDAFPATVTVGIHSKDGFKEINYVPRIKTYKVIGGTGTLVLMVDHVLGTFQWEGMQIEIKPESENARNSGGKHILFDVNNTSASRSFECGMEEVGTGDGHEARKIERSENKSMSGCAEVAIDIDSYTYSTFSSVSNATDWALALMTGVSAIYTQEVGALVFLQTTYVHIWNTPDPMSNYTGQASEMLSAFRSIWLSDPNLSGIQRDETHLLTKRGDTGTGGIAYLDVVCSSYAYGFSGYLSGTTNYNISSYSWNLNVVAHELGHNLGSNHTHWCGWPGGPIDNCGSLEGSCSGYTNNPQGQSGTIMSYCHAIGGGSVNLNFHPTVKAYGLQPAIEGNGSCFTGCDGYEPPVCAMLGIQGGTQLACNPITSSYTQQVVIEYENAPDIGLINVNGTLHTINYSPQTITLVNVPAESQTVDVTAFFTGDETCAATQAACYTQKDPCCAMIRLQYVNPNSNVIRVKNTSPCEGDISDWGVYSNGDYTSFSEIGSGQNLMVPSGAEIQFAWTNWEADPTYGDLQLYGPTNQLMDYIQWGGSGNFDESSSVQLGFWEAGTFVNALPPFEYIGSGEHGAAFWTGTDIPCDISDVTVISSTDCNPSTGNYTVDFSVSYVGAPSTMGGLVVNGDPYTLAPSGATYSLTNTANGSWMNLDVSFADNPSCSFFLGNAIYGPQSCTIECPTDLNIDGSTTVADVLAILSEFGCILNCQYDVDGDASVTVGDVLNILAAFGEICFE
tara:strand:+ start:403 stop:2880 length:2478 start_codon:yes stop_codon:yes gene_type:complete